MVGVDKDTSSIIEQKVAELVHGGYVSKTHAEPVFTAIKDVVLRVFNEPKMLSLQHTYDAVQDGMVYTIAPDELLRQFLETENRTDEELVERFKDFSTTFSWEP